ncbi:hypothetical protein HMPREF1478_00935 [Actinomyces sp. HPA0247]|uniref:hypothetical protein n=1 Tax=Actinomyces sp. HPA0247 TaxID=1203556 RepID=UPI00034EBFBC|nr:hypothetical protein [Actinomyces sp. HPA0247]EPD73283.1 hypothetical protein HMPREF1478_00935 [Actinomyces sp. HPA0247]
MSNDDLRHTSDDAARVHSSDAWDDLSQLDISALPGFGDLPGFADLPELAPLPELDALQESAMPEIVMPDLEMPDLDEFLRVTPPVPTDVPQPDAVPETGSAPTAGAATARTHSASHKAATASSQKRSANKQESRPTAATASPRRQPAATQAPQPAITVGPTPARTPRASVPPRQKKPNLLIAFVALIAIGLGASFLSSTRDGSSSTPWGTQTSSSASTQADSEVREHAADLRTRSPGYRGSATNTHSISPQWASGVATAWTLELPSEMTEFGPQMFAEGQVLYIAGDDTIEGQRGSAVRTQAYDLSGEEPTLLWDTVGPTENSAIMTYTPAFVSSETQLFFHDVVIDKATGEQTQAPWGDDFPLAQADGIVVTCSTTSSCRGWMQTSGEWTNLWTTTTNPQTSYGLSNQGLDYAPAGTTRSGTGELASVLVPSSYQETPQIINIHTGKTTYLPSPAQSGLGQYVEVATDGFVITDVSKKQGFLTDSSGARQSTYSNDEYLRLPAVSRDGNQPSTADIKTFMTKKTANWATGTVGLVDKDDCSIQVTLTSDGSTRTTPVPGVLSPYMTSTCLFSPKEVRVSADGSVLYADTFTYQDQSRYFIDTANGLTYTSNLLNLPKQTMWVFDDMLIGLTDSGLTAFVPASS